MLLKSLISFPFLSRFACFINCINSDITCRMSLLLLAEAEVAESIFRHRQLCLTALIEQSRLEVPHLLLASP